MLTPETVIFDPHTKTRSILTPAQKRKSSSVLTLKPSQFISPHKNQVDFDPNTEVKLTSIPTLNPSQFCMPPDTKTKFILIQTLNQVIFDSRTKPSQFWCLHWNQVKSHPPHWNHVYFDHPHNNQANFDANTKTMSFSGRVALRVTHTSTCSRDTAAKIRII